MTMRVRVEKAFYDRDMHGSHSVGDVFDVTESRFTQIESVLPGYVTKVADTTEDNEPSIKELREMATAKGIKVPRNASRAKLVELLADR